MKKTRFNRIHHELGAKMVEFAGYDMPIQYDSMTKEHMAVRKHAGVFDVSHMGEIFIKGKKALDYVNYVTVNDASKLSPGRVQYSAMCYPDGGIVDDLLVYRIADDLFMLVVNASNIEKDYNWMVENNDFGVEITNRSDDYSLLAVQGPASKKILNKICDVPLKLEYYSFFYAACAGVDVLISRTGYTGELGYELYFEGTEEEAEKLWKAVFEAGEEFGVEPAGLGARDSLRLEMGMALYGNDIDRTTNPIEARLGWITKLGKGEFIGSDTLAKVKEDGPERKLSAMVSDEKAFPRKGYELYKNGEKVGEITSGTVSPVLNKPIALGYVKSEYAREGGTIDFDIRGRKVPAEIIKLPFVKK